LAPQAGIVIGLDLTAALSLGAALGYDTRALAELLPSAEAALVAAINTRLSEEP
jgi:hypothetical protein